MKMKKIFFISFILSIGLVSCGQKINLGNVVNAVLSGAPLSEQEISAGLKEALSVGINLGADKASATDGFFLNPAIKILLPPEVQKVESTLRSIGLGGEVDKFMLSLNRGAEQAAQEAKPIFISAIKQLTITDAINILKGEKDAATQFLRRTTSPQLVQAFEPIMVNSLNKTNATKYYGDIAGTYNKIPFVKQINPDLKGYATQKAIDGLFILVAQEEAKIRENPLARTSELLKRVFGSL
ncbi:MAG: DUF4197 domain-containing protein [Cytophagaceae bacterium]|nr:DUF4197 domain-containing protein [Cytophagaceae bacterium]